MTSSLVGSEMCIRDSLSSAGYIAADEQHMLQSTATGFTTLHQHDVVTAVSYTHLTLPTICSV
eukprot:4990399-Prorocentrum_lima.AAC.1